MEERFVRWQRYTLNQLTFVLNMFFGLAVGAVAFSFTLLRDKEFLLVGCPKFLFKIAIISLCLSVFSSCAAVISRLMDYRYTARKIRNDKNSEFEESTVYKYKSKFFGDLTWRLFWIQTVTLCIGLLGLMVGVFSAYGDRI